MKNEMFQSSGRIWCAEACMKELRRVCDWVERVLGGLRWKQGVLCHQFSLMYICVMIIEGLE